ncbi:DUF302 domain-containing protein [Sphingomonas sp.]|jgi:uncharacterized protein (DUF302 family)|uniref:DUF302 domain-containing protein n=1 Tax=Sphingomonas sp. TaxID=28214 RepID=UPI0025FCADC9|nr:DUF302 domain-containing protein [Sphingomonas sp.]
MTIKTILPLVAAACLGAVTPAIAVAATPGQTLATAPAEGVLRVRSRYPVDETVTRIKTDIAAKGIRFFEDIDQSQLGARAKISLRPSRLLLFGNPPLGVQFLTSNALAGLDWPVRMLVAEDADGSVWVAWTDFAYLGRRYGIADRDAALKMASEVSSSIASSVTK